MASRADNATRVAALQAQGATRREIAQQLGISRSYVSDLINDPEGIRNRERKNSYRKPCPHCGTLMDGSNGTAGPSICTNCIRWTREACIAAVQNWADDNGGIPPRCVDTKTADGQLPAQATARRLFGRWNSLLRAAGFDVHINRDEEAFDAMLDAVRHGESVARIAQEHGVSESAIYGRFAWRSMRVAEERQGTIAA